jgi:hypothetical protein
MDYLAKNDLGMLLKQCIELLRDTGVIISSVTFDGAACNLSMVTELVANFAFLQSHNYKNFEYCNKTASTI